MEGLVFARVAAELAVRSSGATDLAIVVDSDQLEQTDSRETWFPQIGSLS